MYVSTPKSFIINKYELNHYISYSQNRCKKKMQKNAKK